MLLWSSFLINAYTPMLEIKRSAMGKFKILKRNNRPEPATPLSIRRETVEVYGWRAKPILTKMLSWRWRGGEMVDYAKAKEEPEEAPLFVPITPPR